MGRLVGWRSHRGVWEKQNIRSLCDPHDKPATGSAGTWNWVSSEHE